MLPEEFIFFTSSFSLFPAFTGMDILGATAHWNSSKESRRGVKWAFFFFFNSNFCNESQSYRV